MYVALALTLAGGDATSMQHSSRAPGQDFSQLSVLPHPEGLLKCRPLFSACSVQSALFGKAERSKPATCPPVVNR